MSPKAKKLTEKQAETLRRALQEAMAPLEKSGKALAALDALEAEITMQREALTAAEET